MSRLNKLVFCLPFIFLSVYFQAQDRQPINVFLPEDYSGDSQNWAISQSPDRTIYVANNRGLLEFNGAEWRMNKSPNETIIRTVKVIDTLIYTGSFHEFGFWQRDNYGVLKYTSLSTQLKVDFLEDEEFWNILHFENWILFQSLDRIHLYNKKSESYTVIYPKENISRLFKADDTCYFQTLNGGLYRIENGKEVLVTDDKNISINMVVNVFHQDAKLLILTQDNGFFQYSNNSLEPWIIPAIDVLKNTSVFSAIKLKDDGFVLGTISDGVIYINENGELNYSIGQADGLSNNTVLALHEDMDRNIWLALDNGINCINVTSPFSIYVDAVGILGSVYCSLIQNDILYLGTNQGLFYRKMSTNEPFKFIEGTQGQVWTLEYIDNTIFCGHNTGTYVINDYQATRIADAQGTWQIKRIKNEEDLLIQGNYDGLFVLEKKDGKWRLKNKLIGFDISCRYFEFLNRSEIIVNHEYRGVFKLKLDDAFTEVTSFSKDSVLEKGLYSSLIKHNEEVLYSNAKGVFKYDYNDKVFKKDSLLSNLINVDNFTSAKLVSNKAGNKLWSFSSRGINYVETTELSGEKKLQKVTFPADIRKDVTGFESVTPIKGEEYLFGSTSGYVVLDLDKIIEKEHQVAINRIAVSKSKDKSTFELVKLNNELEFKNDNNNLKIHYSISEFLRTLKPEYQYRLDGIYDTWSGWSTSSSVLFENLPYGDYTFKVQGRVGDSATLNTEEFSFRINRPWSLSNIAIGLYALAALFVIILTHGFYKTYYKKQRERLILKTNREFELKELENKQQLMRFRNEKLREDIENKNKELGVSTMNLIKKNEFLNTIKTELQAIDNDRDLKKVIKIIDRNLNNNDDWNLFQEAFNNADKDFLKKIKEIHPTLTSNDLRLCAYLRLNLSSKEIAPLLNISPRSVEVKRYRLRKKMELPHEANLSDYILEI